MSAYIHEDHAAVRRRLLSVLEELNLDALVLTSYEAVSYFAGTAILTQEGIPTRLASLVMTRTGIEEFVVCSIETSLVREQTDISAIFEYKEFVVEPEALIAERVKAHCGPGARIGFEESHMVQAVYGRFAGALAGYELVYASDAIATQWTIKPQTSVDILADAARATVAAIENAAATSLAGEPELDFAARISQGLTEGGSVPKFIVVAVGKRSTQAHPVADAAPLTEGDIWRVDVGGRFGRFLSDIARTGVVGEPSDRQKEVMKKLHLVQAAGIAKLVPGNRACDVFHAVEAEFERQGLPFIMPHVGHAFGIGLHEKPMLHPKDTSVIEVGMVFCVEPLVLFPEIDEGYHTEDLVVVTADGPLLLTTPQTELIQIPVRA